MRSLAFLIPLMCSWFNRISKWMFQLWWFPSIEPMRRCQLAGVYCFPYKKKGTRNVEINRTEDAYISSKKIHTSRANKSMRDAKKPVLQNGHKQNHFDGSGFQVLKGFFNAKLCFACQLAALMLLHVQLVYRTLCIVLVCIAFAHSISTTRSCFSRLFWIFFQMTRTHMLGIHGWHACIKDSMCWIRWMCT